MPRNSPGRIDIHSHLLPGVDDGCKSVDDSIKCARMLINAGYSHAFCTPHVWPNLPHNNVAIIPLRTAELQQAFNERKVPLELHPGGELNLQPNLLDIPPDEIVTFALNRKFLLIDFWSDSLPPYFEPVMKRFQSFGIKIVLAHPERIRAVQLDPPLVDKFLAMDILLQGNLQCFSDPPGSRTRSTVELLLHEKRYTFLGSDTHGSDTLAMRLGGLASATELAGHEYIAKLTIENPKMLLPKSAFD